MTRLKTDRALVVDLELTCWDGEPPEGQSPEIIEIGIVEVSLDPAVMSIVREGRYLVRPRRSQVSEFCTQLTGLDASDLRKHGKPLAEVARTVRKAYGSAAKPWFAWGSDDEAIVREIAGLDTVAPFAGPFINLALLFGMAHPQDRRWGLSDAARHYELAWEGSPHRALDDARMTGRILIEFMRRQREGKQP